MRHNFWEFGGGVRANLPLLRGEVLCNISPCEAHFSPPPPPPDDYCTAPKKSYQTEKKSVILAGKTKSEKMRRMKMRIITCFGDRPRSTDNFDLNVFNGATSPRVFSYQWRIQTLS